MRDQTKTKQQLVNELLALRQRIAELEAACAERERAIESLAQEKRLLDALLDNSPDIIYFKDVHSRFIRVNKAKASKHGLSPEQLVGKTDFEFTSEEFARRAYQEEQEIIITGKSFIEREELTRLPNGREMWVSITKMPLRDETGKIIGTFGISREITERKRTEAILERRVAQLALLGDIGKKIAAVLELDSVLDRAAHLAQESFGYHHVGLFTLDRERGELVMRARAGEFVNLFPPEHRIKLGQGMVGWVGSTGQKLLANDVRTESRYINFYPDLIPTRSELSVPIRVGEAIVGVLDAQSPQYNAFDENDVMVMEALADQIAIAIENARLYEAVQRELAERRRAEEELKRRAAQVALLSDVGKQIAAVLELESVLNRAAALVRQSFGYHHVALFTVDRERGELVMRAKAGDYAHLFPPDHRIKLKQGIVGWVGEYGARLLANDVRTEPRYTNFFPDLIPTLSELGVPILVGDQVMGVLDVQSPKINAFDENDIMVLEILADQVAVAIENARLYEAARRELAERQRAEEQLEQSNEELRRFTYIVSHDLRAPLVNLKGFSTELRTALEVIQPAFKALLPQLTPDQRSQATTALLQDIPEALNFIEASVDRMDHFINALLKLSRLGRRELDLELVDMTALVRNTLETLAHQIEQRQVKVTVGCLPNVVADRTSMEQIMGNILNNAVIYLQPGRPGEIEITGERSEAETIFRIRDNGRGIAPEDMDKVFAPFRRAGPPDVPGEGMGLAYVQTLVRRHGGRIWCDSEPNVGTTFTFTISNYLTKGNSNVQ